MSTKKVGIASLGLHLPSLALPLEELARLRSVDPDKYLIGLGCKKMALCPDHYTVVDLATEAAKRALSRWDGDKSKIGLIAVGTESGEDTSRPLSAWVAENLGLKGALRSYEVKHACYGGTLALRQATEWKLAGIAPDKAAIVIAADISLYEPNSAAEPTQGAGAVAMIIDEPHVAEIEPISYPFSMPAFDFWHPINEPFPMVDGQFSLECYKRAARDCFQAFIRDRSLDEVLALFEACCFHTPFPKMVKKAFFELGQFYGWDDNKIEKIYRQKVEPTFYWNQQSGNAYTASLWIAVAYALCKLQIEQKITAFSYGSGCGAELIILKAGPLASQAAWAQDVERDLSERKEIDAEAYEEMRRKK